MERITNITDLPDAILSDIIARRAPDNLYTIGNIRSVLSRFCNICASREVHMRLSLEFVPFYPWNGNDETFNTFYERLCEAKNFEALYRTFVRYYFRDDRQVQGLNLLRQACQKEVTQTRLLYETILVCHGGANTEEGYRVLADLFKPTLAQTLRYLHGLRRSIFHLPAIFGQYGRRQLLALKASYVKFRCRCNGQFLEHLIFVGEWEDYGVIIDG